MVDSGKRKTDNRRISEMRNLGPACEEDLNAVGIHTAQDLLDAGVEGAFLSILSRYRQQRLSAKRLNATYLYALFGAIHNIDWREIPEAKKIAFKQFAAEIRQTRHLR